MRGRAYINGVAVLNTDFTWTTPSNQGIPPSRRSHASAAILDGAHLTVAFGNKCCLIMRCSNITKVLYFYPLHVQKRSIAQYLVQRYQCARSGWYHGRLFKLASELHSRRFGFKFGLVTRGYCWCYHWLSCCGDHSHRVAMEIPTLCEMVGDAYSS